MDTFETVVVPHLGAAHRLARWILRNDDDANDAVQEASLRALRYFRTFTGGSGRAWFLQIVRNTCMFWRGQRAHAALDAFDEEQHSAARPTIDPETQALHADDANLIAAAMKELPARSRRLIELRELQGLSYRELSTVMALPMGTVMSGLSRARHALRESIAHINDLRHRAA